VARTVVISDLHIGAPDNHSVVEQPAIRARLLEALTAGDTLVLLGDTVELARPARGNAIATAAPILRELGGRIGPLGRIVLVPGNHDHALIAAWSRRQGAGLEREALVPADASPELARVVRELGSGGAPVEVRYPGVWLGEGIWATHGHYTGSLGARPAGARPSDYEHHAAFRFSRVAALLRPWMAPVTAAVLDRQLRVRALASVVQMTDALGVEADYVIFGHVHRLGPLPQDDPAAWAGRNGRPRLLNSGSWRFEPLLLNRARSGHRFWPGGAVIIEAGSPPRATSLLGEVTVAELAARQPVAVVADAAPA
jgi:UDP-2,3-diacylglucosamine pyrophosphatase LpxH